MNNTNSNYNQGQNTTSQNHQTPPRTNYPRRKSTATMIAGIVLILMGVSYVINKFLPWVFDWLDSGLVIAAAAIVFGFGLLVKR